MSNKAQLGPPANFPVIRRIFPRVEFSRLPTQFITLCLFVFLFGCSNETTQIYEKTTQKPLENIIQDAEFAITENNFRITNRLHIGSAIKERGCFDFPQNEIILFCNLTIAEEMLKIDSSSSSSSSSSSESLFPKSSVKCLGPDVKLTLG